MGSCAGVRTLFVEPGSPCERGYNRFCTGGLADELLNGEFLDALVEARVLVERWGRQHTTGRPWPSVHCTPPVSSRPDGIREGRRCPLCTVGVGLRHRTGQDEEGGKSERAEWTPAMARCA